jgi:hypothetical protein
MRRLYVGLVVVLLVALALSIGVNIGLMLGRQSSEGSASPAPTQTPAATPSAQPTELPTPTPIPTAAVTPSPQTTTITDQNITVNYSEYRRESSADGATTTVVVSIDVQYQGEAVTLEYSRFHLSILTSRGGLEPYPIYLESSQAHPFESGSITVGESQSQASFRLTFRFSTLQQTSMGGITAFHGYELRYV